jgi:hypothetical protein
VNPAGEVRRNQPEYIHQRTARITSETLAITQAALGPQ